MKIMTFNIQHALDYQNKVIDLDLFAAAIARFGADVCGLNEVRGEGDLDGYTDQTNALGDRLGFERYFAEAIKVRGKGPYGNALVSRFPIISAETISIPDPEVKREGGHYESRCVLNVTLDVDGRELCVLVCHMGLVDDEAKNAVSAICSILDATDKPVILMGDFNLTPDSEILRPIKEKMKDTAELFCKDLLSFPSDNPYEKIDYIFVTPDVEVISADIPAIVASDHRPHVAELDLKI